MRRSFWLLLLLAGCAGPDSDPVEVAGRFHELRIQGDDPGIHALLTESDRAAVPMEAFPAELPSNVMADLMGWGDARVDSAALLTASGDTATVVLHIAGGHSDTLRLVATHYSEKVLFLERARTRWRVSLGLAERARLDSLAAAIRADASSTDDAVVELAEAYIEAAERNPDLVRPVDLDAARTLLRGATVAESLRIGLRLTRTIDGVPFLEGRVQNPTERRVSTLVLTVRDGSGAEESFELWGIEPGSSKPIRRITRLEREPLTHRIDRIQVF